MGDGFVVGHSGAASKHHREAFVAEVFVQDCKCLRPVLAQRGDRWKKDEVGRTEEERGVFVATGMGEHAGDADEGGDKTVAVAGAWAHIHCLQIGLQ